ncbi:hypothetical protein TgHK011_005445 [Trichoderma gracile]|nr:hypothetical protein TgHK011_005445 [Trichoderma gracile]
MPPSVDLDLSYTAHKLLRNTCLETTEVLRARTSTDEQLHVLEKRPKLKQNGPHSQNQQPSSISRTGEKQQQDESPIQSPRQ